MPNAVSIDFHNADIGRRDAIRKAYSLFQYIYKNIDNIELLKLASEGIRIFHKYNIFQNQFNGWASRIPKHIISENFKDGLIAEMQDFYNSCLHSDELLSKARGVLLELILEHLIRPRYQKPPCKFGIGCQVILNGNMIYTADRSTVDVAGWDCVFGEFYEAKVGPENFESQVFLYLQHLKHELDDKQVKYSIGCVTMETMENLRLQIRKMERIMQQDLSSFSLYGKKEILSLKEPVMLVMKGQRRLQV